MIGAPVRLEKAGKHSAGLAPCFCDQWTWSEGLLCVPVQSAFDQGRLANLTSFVNNAVLFTVAATHVVELTRSAVSGNAGICAASISCRLLL